MKKNLLNKTLTYFTSFLFTLLPVSSFTQIITNSLFEAIIRNDIIRAEYMIKQRADIRVTNEDGFTVLHLVSDPDLALTLIQNGADVSAQNRFGSTPLHWAVTKNYEPIVRLLLQFGADPNSVDNNGNTPLHFAINSSEEIVLLLIRSGANVNITNSEGSTALVEALLHNNSKYSKHLTLAGAENIKNKQGLYPSLLDDPLEIENSIKQVLISGPVDPLIKEIFVENYQQAIKLIRGNIPLNSIDVNGDTALHWAFTKKHRYLSRLLLKKGADYEIFNYNDKSAIDILLNSGDTNFIEYIQEILKDKTNFYDPKKTVRNLP